MKVTVTIDGKENEVEVAPGDLKLADAAKVQKIIGDDAWDSFAAGNVRPVAFQAVLLVKLRHKYPELKMDDFDATFMETLVNGEDEDEGEQSPS